MSGKHTFSSRKIISVLSLFSIILLLIGCSDSRVGTFTVPEDTGYISVKKANEENCKLTAWSDPGYTFDYWDGYVAGESSIIVVPNEKADVTARFKPIENLPVIISGYNELVIKKISLEINQMYSNVDNNNFALKSLNKEICKMLECIGIKAADKGEQCDASLKIDATCEALGAYYECESSIRYEYTGAVLNGEAVFCVDGQNPLNITLNIRLDPTDKVAIMLDSATHGGPMTAPFGDVWGCSMLELMNEIWGHEAPLRVAMYKGCFLSLGSYTYTDSCCTSYYSQKGQTFATRLFGALKAPDHCVRRNAIETLYRARLFTSEDIPLLREALDDPCIDVVKNSARALRELDAGAEVVPALVEQYNSGLLDENEKYMIRTLIIEIVGQDVFDKTYSSQLIDC
jgi:hypothetical protein